jgi:hypothetical protein
MKFKIDENLPIEVAVALREAGHDAMSVVEQGSAGTRMPPEPHPAQFIVNQLTCRRPR